LRRLPPIFRRYLHRHWGFRLGPGRHPGSSLQTICLEPLGPSRSSTVGVEDSLNQGRRAKPHLPSYRSGDRTSRKSPHARHKSERVHCSGRRWRFAAHGQGEVRTGAAADQNPARPSTSFPAATRLLSNRAIVSPDDASFVPGGVLLSSSLLLERSRDRFPTFPVGVIS
jgi:hypothetical protein